MEGRKKESRIGVELPEVLVNQIFQTVSTEYNVQDSKLPTKEEEGKWHYTNVLLFKQSFAFKWNTPVSYSKLVLIFTCKCAKVYNQSQYRSGEGEQRKHWNWLSTER